MANYTINNIPNVADDVKNADILPIWKSDEEKTAQVPVSTLMAGTKVLFASSTTVSGNTLASGSVLRIMFTSALTGSDTTTGLTITYNGTPYAVKVCKQGALADFVATEINSSYYYLQAYTTLELAFNGGAFVIIGNPVVLSSDDYTIYADGSIKYTTFYGLQDMYAISNKTDKGIYLESGALALTSEQIWLKTNNYYDGTNDIVIKAGYASQVNISQSYLRKRTTLSSHSAGDVITDWSDWTVIG